MRILQESMHLNHAHFTREYAFESCVSYKRVCVLNHTHFTREYAFESCAGELSAKLMNSKYSVFYHEHVLNKEPGTEKKPGFTSCSLDAAHLLKMLQI